MEQSQKIKSVLDLLCVKLHLLRFIQNNGYLYLKVSKFLNQNYLIKLFFQNLYFAEIRYFWQISLFGIEHLIQQEGILTMSAKTMITGHDQIFFLFSNAPFKNFTIFWCFFAKFSKLFFCFCTFQIV